MALAPSARVISCKLLNYRDFFSLPVSNFYVYNTELVQKTCSKQQGIKNKLLRATVRNMSCEIMEEKEPAAVTVVLAEKPLCNETKGQNRGKHILALLSSRVPFFLFFF